MPGGYLDKIRDLILRLWKRGQNFLWVVASAGAAVFVILMVGWWFGIGNGPDLFKAYGVPALIVAVSGVIFGIWRKSGDHPKPAVEPSGSVADVSGFRMRLRVRLAKGLTSEATSLNVMVMNRDVVITSQNKGEPLSKTKWIVLGTRGFSSEEDAWHFGTRLRSIVQLAALSSRLGANVGEDKATDWIREDFAREIGLLKTGDRLAPNIHGLSIWPDDDNTRFPISDAQLTVTADPNHFTSALTELGESGEISLGAASNAVRLLNLALMTSEPLAQMVLSFSAVEELGQNQKWSKAQEALIEELAMAAEASSKGTAQEREEVAQAIRKGLFPLSLRQGVMRLLSRIGLDHLRKEWDRLYALRSGLFHGTARLSDPEINQAALDTMTLCGRIIRAWSIRRRALLRL
jgi:hypothetical protein